METPAIDVLRGKIDRIKGSNVDPACLAGKLLSADIVGVNDAKRARNERELVANRLGDLVLTLMGNGAPNVFQTFVEILLNEGHLKWLGKELKGNCTHDIASDYLSVIPPAQMYISRRARRLCTKLNEAKYSSAPLMTIALHIQI